MSPLSSLSDSELVERLPVLVRAERHAMVEVIEHLVEMERRRLYLRFDLPSLGRYCTQRLGYSDDAAFKRQRVAKVALHIPQVLEELRAGTMNLTGLFLLSAHLSQENAATMLREARGNCTTRFRKLETF